VKEEDGKIGGRRLHQYQMEKHWAARLLAAAPESRPALYQEIYNAVVMEFPEYREYQESITPNSTEIVLQAKFLESFVNGNEVFLELGSGTGHLARRMTSKVRKVLALDASRSILSDKATEGFQSIQGDATRLDLPNRSIDLAYSCHFIEHLHPDDARQHLMEVRRALTGGGRYICITPNRLYGPHDVSRYFSRTARGLHLKEYTNRELMRLYHDAGYSAVRPFSYDGLSHLLAWERLAALVPRRLRLAVVDRFLSARPFRPMEQVVVIGRK